MNPTWREIRKAQHRFEEQFRAGDELSYTPLFKHYQSLCHEVFASEESAAECFKYFRMTIETVGETIPTETIKTKWNAIWYAVAADNQELLQKIKHSRAYFHAHITFPKERNIISRLFNRNPAKEPSYELCETLNFGYGELKVAAIYRNFSAINTSDISDFKEFDEEDGWAYLHEQWAFLDAIATPTPQPDLLPIALQFARSDIDSHKLHKHFSERQADLADELGSGDMLATAAGVVAHIRIAQDAGLSVNLQDWLNPQQIAFWGL